MRIVADPNIPFVREAFAALGEIQLAAGRQIRADTVRDADLLLVRSVTPVTPVLLEGSRVKFVATATIGTDHVDLDYLAAHGVGFASAAGSNANSVAEYVVAGLLELARRKKFRLREKTLGVIGVGNVGRRVAQYAEALGMRVLANDPPRQRTETLPQFVSLDRLLAEAGIVTLHVPLVRDGADATVHLVGPDVLCSLTRQVVLVNTARGAVVDNRALLEAVHGQRLAGVMLDVWENEPDISGELLEVVDLGTPHIAGYSFDGKVNGTRMIYEAACRFFGRQPTWDPTPLIPAPAVPRLEVDVGAGEDDEDVLGRTIARIYDIAGDDAALRQSPRSFDRLRAAYPIRREFRNTRLALHGATEKLSQKAAALGFGVV